MEKPVAANRPACAFRIPSVCSETAARDTASRESLVCRTLLQYFGRRRFGTLATFPKGPPSRGCRTQRKCRECREGEAAKRGEWLKDDKTDQPEAPARADLALGAGEEDAENNSKNYFTSR